MKRLANYILWSLWLLTAVLLLAAVLGSSDRFVDQTPRWIAFLILFVVMIILRFDAAKVTHSLVPAGCCLLMVGCIWVTVPSRGRQNLYIEAMKTQSELIAFDASFEGIDDLSEFKDCRNLCSERFAAYPELRWVFAQQRTRSEEAVLDTIFNKLILDYSEVIDVSRTEELAHHIEELSGVVTESQLSELDTLLVEALAQCDLKISSKIRDVEPNDVSAYEKVRDEWKPLSPIAQRVVFVPENINTATSTWLAQCDRRISLRIRNVELNDVGTYENIRDEWKPLSPIAQRVAYVPERIKAATTTWRDSSNNAIVEGFRELRPLDTDGFSTLRKTSFAVRHAAGGSDERSDKLALAEKEWLVRSLTELKERYPLQESVSTSECRLLHFQAVELFTIFFQQSRSSSLSEDFESGTSVLSPNEYKESIESISDHLNQYLKGLISKEQMSADLVNEFLENEKLRTQLDESRWSSSYGHLGCGSADLDALRQRSVDLLLATWNQGIENARSQVIAGRYAEAAKGLDELMEAVREASIELHRCQLAKQIVLEYQEKRGYGTSDHADVLTIRAAALRFNAVRESIGFLVDVQKLKTVP